MSRPLFLALDFGSSANRAVLFDLQGTLLWKTAERHALEGVGDSLDATEVEASLLRLLRMVEAALPAGELAGIGVSAQLGMALLDADGRPVGPVTTWMDRRAASEARELAATVGTERIYRVAGRRPDPELIACKLLRLRRQAPERVARLRWVLSLKDYLVFLLTGRAVTDPAHASYSMLADVAQVKWSEDLVQVVGVPLTLLPPIQPGTAIAGSLQTPVAAATGLPSGLPVAVCGPDGTVGAVGAGMVRRGVAVDVMGTSDVLLVATDQPCFHPGGATLVNAHVVPGLWVSGGPMTTTGGALQWMAQALLGSRPEEVTMRLAELERAARDLPPGSDGLFAFPSLVGERAPFWEPERRGAFLGVGLGHRAEHFYRALVEGASYLVRMHLEALKECGVGISEFVLAGGGSGSILARQVRSEICDRPATLCPVQETTALGVALLTAVATGHFASAEEAARRMLGPGTLICPDPADRAAYARLYPTFCRLRASLNPVHLRNNSG